MSKKLLLIIACLAFLASVSMYMVGKDSSHLSELYDLFWIPLPLGIIAALAAMLKKDK